MTVPSPGASPTPTPTPTPTASAVKRGARFDDASAIAGAIDAVVDYRGDVTLTCTGFEQPLAGYVYDVARHPDAPDDPARTRLRLLPADGGTRVTIPLADVVALEVTGRDTAEGKSFETWVRKYVERRLEQDA